MALIEKTFDSVPDGDRPLTRSEFAARVGVSAWTLLRYHRDGTFKAFACDSKGGRAHPAIYLESQVDEFRALTPRVQPHDFQHNALYSVEQAQSCFKAFEEGRSARWCVINLAVHPQVISIIRARYVALDQGVFLTRDEMTRILALGLDGPSDIGEGTDVVKLLEQAKKDVDRLEKAVAEVRSPRCLTCKGGEAKYCPSCVSNTLEEAKRPALQKQTGAEPEGPAPAAVSSQDDGVSPARVRAGGAPRGRSRPAAGR